MGRFNFLQEKFGELYSLCSDSEKYAHIDESVSMLKARQAIEYIVRFCGCKSDDLFEGLVEMESRNIASQRIIGRFHFIRKRANQSVHNNESADVDKVLDSLKEICVWFVGIQKRSGQISASHAAEKHQNSQQYDEQEIADVNYKSGIACYYGNNTRQDYKKAAEYLKKAAMAGHPDAQYKLGIMYRFGKGVVQDDQIARGWLRQAADQGHTKAQRQLEPIQRENRQHSSGNSVLSKFLLWLLKLLVAVIIVLIVIHFR